MFANSFRRLSVKFFHLPTPIVRTSTFTGKQKSKQQSNHSSFALALLSQSTNANISTPLSLQYELPFINTRSYS
jgi:hypothetical protein